MLEGILVGLIVAFAALQVARRFLPRRRFGAHAAASPTGGCDTGCGTCGGCGSVTPPPRSVAKPLTRG